MVRQSPQNYPYVRQGGGGGLYLVLADHNGNAQWFNGTVQARGEELTKGNITVGENHLQS